MVQRDEDIPDGTDGEGVHDHAAGADAALQAPGEVEADDLTQDGKGHGQTHEGGAAADIANVKKEEVDQAGFGHTE